MVVSEALAGHEHGSKFHRMFNHYRFFGFHHDTGLEPVTVAFFSVRRRRSAEKGFFQTEMGV